MDLPGNCMGGLLGEISRPSTPIHATTQVIGDLTVNAVETRGPHPFLGMARHTSTGIKDQIEAHDFTEHRDFTDLPGRSPKQMMWK